MMNKLTVCLVLVVLASGCTLPPTTEVAMRDVVKWKAKCFRLEEELSREKDLHRQCKFHCQELYGDYRRMWDYCVREGVSPNTGERFKAKQADSVHRIELELQLKSEP